MVVILMAFDVVLAGTGGVKRKIELVFPPEFKTRLAHGIVAHLCAGVSFGNISSMGGYLIGYNAVANIFQIWECKMLFWSHITYPLPYPSMQSARLR